MNRRIIFGTHGKKGYATGATPLLYLRSFRLKWSKLFTRWQAQILIDPAQVTYNLD